MTHFERLKNEAQVEGREVGIINGSEAIILERDSDGHVRWYLYETNGEACCIGPEEYDDTYVQPRLAGKSLTEILDVIETNERRQSTPRVS